MRASVAPSFARVLLPLVLVAVAPSLASAANPPGDPAAVNKVTNLNKKALDAYNKQDYDTARTTLKEALEICATAGLDQHPITARTHIHFGIVAIVGYKQREVGIKQFRKALEIQPDIKLTKQLATPDLQEAFEEAVLSGDKGGSRPPEESPQASEDGEDRPRRGRPGPRPRKPSDDDEKDDDDDGQSGVFFLAFQGGTGLGVASGNGTLDPSAHKVSSAGFAVAQAGQIAPEIGFFASKDLLISVALRLQMVSGVNGKPVTNNNCGSDMFCAPSTTSAAGFAKVTYLLGSAPFHIAVGGQIGGGYIRHAVKFKEDVTCKESADATTLQSCVDTLNGGPFLIGPTIGIFYELGSMLNLMLTVNSALGVPNFAFNLDVQGGIGVRL